jgi:hypothetical protein
MGERMISAQWARLFIAGLVTAIVMSVSLYQLFASSRDTQRPPKASVWSLPGSDRG